MVTFNYLLIKNCFSVEFIEKKKNVYILGRIESCWLYFLLDFIL